MPRWTLCAQKIAMVLGSAMLLGIGGATAYAEDTPLDALTEAIQDEYRAYETYSKVVRGFGTVRPFVNIIQAEARHIEVLAQLFVDLGVAPPESQWDQTNVPTYETLQQACAAGVKSEIANIAMYDRLLQLRLPADVRSAFQALQAASQERHLPAFQRCSGA